ncbi:DUF134 domain-containing protein [Geoglobus acetivorans]|uniref:DUF134 domain-containing protein n=1 Tax=Geoglobus acetivorans TaxID=565033 RepID=A0ABZ3H5G0_GEOAI|nr:DUF134 domain-containing protein [Geoglobus acetivorans]
MPRRKRKRFVEFSFHEKGGEVAIYPDEAEAVRLVDIMGFSQKEAAELMGISQPTISRLLESARKKLGIAMLESRKIRIVFDDSFIEVRRCGKCFKPVEKCRCENGC